MAEISKLAQITSTPGVRRDGTQLDSDYFTDGQWVRWYRGRAKKMGGFVEITDELAGPVRSTLVWSRGLMNALYSFSSGAVEMNIMDNEGVGSALYDRTPAGFTSNVDHIWSVDTMYDDAVGSQGTIVIAVATNSLTNIDDPTNKQVYFGLADDNAALTPISGLQVSGGVVAIAPYLVYYGSDGLVGWTDVNQPQTLTGGDAGADRITGAKIVKGLPMRSGSGPAALLWSLDSVIQMQWVGGDAIFRFNTITAQSSILSQNSVIEYDGAYFWVGVDRFMAYSGGQVAELPNQMNLNWFFNNLAFRNRQKVWAMKVPRWGEIHWYFPFGDADECTHCVIFNVREKTWYDCALPRGAGYYSQVFHYPAMVGAESSEKSRLTFSTSAGSFQVGDIVKGVTSGATAQILVIPVAGVMKVTPVSGPTAFTSGEGLTNLTRSGTGTATGQQFLYSAYVHEKGVDAIVGETQSAIPSWFTTSDFGLPTGGAFAQNNVEGMNRWTRLTRVEPDFAQAGDMTVEVIGREFAQTPDVVSEPLTFSPSTGKIDMREQRRQIRLKFSSNTLGGDYEMGRVIMHTEPGDVRS